MVNKIYELKNKILMHVEKEMQDMQRMNVKEVGELVDMVKDLAEAEKDCIKATYYDEVTKAMKGESRSGYGNAMGYGSSRQGAQGGNMGYGNMGYGNMGYSQNAPMGHDDLIEKLGEEYRNLSPDERIRMKSSILAKLGSM